MATKIKFDRQLAEVLNLSIPPHKEYELRSYKVEQIGRTGTVSVERTYSQPGMKTEWHECVFVGPRGGTKTIYKSFY